MYAFSWSPKSRSSNAALNSFSLELQRNKLVTEIFATIATCKGLLRWRNSCCQDLPWPVGRAAPSRGKGAWRPWWTWQQFRQRKEIRWKSSLLGYTHVEVTPNPTSSGNIRIYEKCHRYLYVSHDQASWSDEQFIVHTACQKISHFLNDFHCIM